ncbi:hypothetical protein RJ639_011589 [Escallonia herrerae]|uniref:Rotamase n=1 Tax=Escallonia herrerae TaxID=1293975 RepID=A0AA89AQC4_9ASTE|nr:hypothetical protein RJ639_011589 [Escallonia herrerae]
MENVEAGFEEGIGDMKPGGKRRIIIPPELGPPESGPSRSKVVRVFQGCLKPWQPDLKGGEALEEAPRNAFPILQLVETETGQRVVFWKLKGVVPPTLYSSSTNCEHSKRGWESLWAPPSSTRPLDFPPDP